MDGPHLRIQPRPSALQWRLQCALHAAAALGAMCNALPLPWRCTLLLIVVLGLLREWRRHVSGVAPMLLCDGERWRVADRDHVTDITLLPDSRVLLRTVVVRWREPGRRLPRTLLLFPDSSDADTLRRLRVCLRLGTGLPAEPAHTTGT